MNENESHQTLQAVRKSLTCEEFGQDLPQSMQRWAEVGVRKGCTYTNKYRGLIAPPRLRRLRHRLENVKDRLSGVFSDLGTYVV